jgi:hypothetical protein
MVKALMATHMTPQLEAHEYIGKANLSMRSTSQIAAAGDGFSHPTLGIGEALVRHLTCSAAPGSQTTFISLRCQW